MLMPLNFCLALLVTGTAALIDLRTGRIPNWLTLPLLAIGPALNGACFGLQGFTLSVVGLLLAALVPLLLWWMSKGAAIGGGDLKLFAGLGALLGPIAGLESQWSAYIVLVVFAFGQLAFKGQLLRVLLNTGKLALGWVLPKSRRPHVATELLTELRMGPAIFFGCVIASWMHTGGF